MLFSFHSNYALWLQYITKYIRCGYGFRFCPTQFTSYTTMYVSYTLHIYEQSQQNIRTDMVHIIILFEIVVFVIFILSLYKCTHSHWQYIDRDIDIYHIIHTYQINDSYKITSNWLNNILSATVGCGMSTSEGIQGTSKSVSVLKKKGRRTSVVL